MPVGQSVIFDRGIIWSYAFNHIESARCFEKRVANDPSCVMANWDIANVLGPNYNKPWDMFDLKDLRGSLCKRCFVLMFTKETWTGFTNSNVATASSLEQALIHAIGVSFPRNVSEQDYASYNQAYVKAMEPIYQSHSEDLDVVTLYADALINLAPKHLWNRKTGELNAYARTLDTKEVIEKTFKHHPYTLRHPGLIHMYIHLMETSPTPEAALPAANHLRNMVPDAGHLNHMPSHLDCLVGDCWPPQIYAVMKVGRYSTVIAAVSHMEHSIPEQILLTTPLPMANWLELFHSVHFHRKQALYCVTTATLHYAKGIALAATGAVCRAGNYGGTFERPREAVGKEDELQYSEPPPWMVPTRHALGRPLRHPEFRAALEQGEVDEAAKAYVADLVHDKGMPQAKRHPGNVGALRGYNECLVKIGRVEEAQKMEEQLEAARKAADVEIKVSYFCRNREHRW
ncbi:tetratricopeptide repeat domain protein [Macrophomina phaseolina]|uniref:Tetratricopeptide repeat domain protein n=1 Tax=Macrophomina phaseolina TaxID=35725 RepID=A0ABQ8GFA9_9PEZI|nr:tetratricopeptide repeat domain protein [Macrophomina phaseolina]